MNRVRRAPKLRRVLEEDVRIVSPTSGAELKLLALPERGSDDALRLQRVLKPQTGGSPMHVHLDVTETFEVQEGIADARLDDLTLRLTKGRARMIVPAGVPHANPRNRDIVDLVYHQTFRPATDAVRSYVATLADVLSEGRDVKGDVPLMLLAALTGVTDGRTYLSRVPFSLQRRLLPLSSVVAGTQGYTVGLLRDRSA